MKSRNVLLWLTVAFVVLGWGIGNPTFIPAANAISMTVPGGSATIQGYSLTDRVLEYNSGAPQVDAGIVQQLNSGDSLYGIAPASGDSPNGLGDMVLGGSNLIELVSGYSAIGYLKFETNFNFDPAKLTDRQSLRSDFSIALEIDELFDFSALAVASFIPDIRFWMDGNRWAHLDSSLNGFKIVSGFDYGINKNIGPGTAQASTHSGVSDRSSGIDQDDTSTRSDTHSRSLSEFLSDMFFKMIKLPITYVILFIGLMAFVINLNRQPRV